ncbi:MAG: glycosyl hydrolase [Polyangiaceae bacterium]
MIIRKTVFVPMLLLLASACGESSSSSGEVGGASSSIGGSSGTTTSSSAVGGTTSATGGQSSAATGGTTNPAGGTSAVGGSTGFTTGPLVNGTVTVNGATPKPVSSLFFGQNYWSWVPSWGDPVAKVETKTKELKLRLLRAGGANNDKQSPIAFSLSEIDDFVAFAKNVGAEPLLQIPLIKNISGTEATASDAADLVTYVNITKKYGIKYFSIGNEPDLYTEQSLRATTYDAVAYCTEFKSFATAMKAVDPSIKILGPELSWKYQSGANDWLTPFLNNCGDVTDAVAVHRYPLGPTACTEGAAFADVEKYKQLLTRLRAIMTATGQADKPLMVTEANVTWDGDPTKSTMAASPGTFPAALWVADNIGASLEAEVDNVSYWSLSEGWTLGFFDGTNARPAFHVLRLFSNHFGTEVLSVTGSPTGVSIFAGRDAAAQKSTLFIVNKTTSPLALDVQFAGLPRTANVSLEVAPRTLLVAGVADDGSAPTRTTFTQGDTAPSDVIQ